MKDLNDLQQVVRMKFEREQQVLAELLSKEAALRVELLRLDSLNAQAKVDTDETLRAIGADMIWDGWVGRARSQLNMKLARILANKAHHQDKVRQVYGKVLVVEGLIKQAKNQKNQRMSKQELSRAIDGSIY
tara:strand:- start:371 stop:766 length:396 start_codon:yes stop_codon:yes gene_type:complete